MGLYLNSLSGNLALANSLYQTSQTKVNIMKRLSSGIRINSASDDAAGLSLSQKLKSVINGNSIAKNNAQTGISFLNTADSAISVMTASLERIRTLAVQSSNGVYSNNERQMLQSEVNQLSSNINQSCLSAKFGTKSVFGGEVSAEYDAAIATGYDDAHIITNATDFVSKINLDLAGSFVLASDIDMSSLGTITKAAITGNFTGTFDGNGHTISGAKITATSAHTNIGIFSQNSGIIKNLAVQNSSLDCTGTGTGATCFAGILIGRFTGGSLTNVTVSDSTITLGNNWQGIGVMSAGGFGAAGIPSENCSVTNSNIYGGDNCRYICGFGNPGTTTARNCYSSVNIYLGNNAVSVGGFRADVAGGYNAQNCYSAGTITVGNNSSNISGFACSFDSGATATNCYSTVDIKTGTNANRVGGFTDSTDAASPITNSYTLGNIITGAGSVNVGGFVGTGGALVNNTNFYKNNLNSSAGSAVNESIAQSTLPQNSWNTSTWDLSTSTPTLRNCEANLTATFQSSSEIQIGAEADETSRIDTLQRLVLNSISFDISSQAGAQASISKIDAKIQELNTYRSNIGSSTNKLQSILNLDDSRITNLSDSKSTIYDADMAIESANFIKAQIREKAGTTLLSQTKNIDHNLLMSLINSNGR